MKKLLGALAAITAVIFIIAYISEITTAVLTAIERCLNVIIPSLFLMMVLSRYIVSKRLFEPLEKLMYLPSKLLGFSPRLMAVFILSNIGGYPIGASMLSQMKASGEITSKQTEVCASYCFCSGPAFLVGAVGLCVYGSKSIGYMMFLSCVLANLAACIIYNRVFGISRAALQGSKSTQNTYTITDAISDSGKAMFSMCAVIVSFSAVTVVLQKTCTVFDIDSTLLAPIFEITNVTYFSGAKLSLLPYSAALVSFGGLCVWLQNASLIKKSFSILKTLLLRIPISVLSGIIFKGIYSTFSDRYMASSAELGGLVVNIDNFAPSICLIIMIFMILNKKRLAFQ